MSHYGASYGTAWRLSQRVSVCRELQTDEAIVSQTKNACIRAAAKSAISCNHQKAAALMSGIQRNHTDSSKAIFGIVRALRVVYHGHFNVLTFLIHLWEKHQVCLEFRMPLIMWT